jgi:hypothetical protein
MSAATVRTVATVPETDLATVESEIGEARKVRADLGQKWDAAVAAGLYGLAEELERKIDAQERMIHRMEARKAALRDRDDAKNLAELDGKREAAKVEANAAAMKVSALLTILESDSGGIGEKVKALFDLAEDWKLAHRSAIQLGATGLPGIDRTLETRVRTTVERLIGSGKAVGNVFQNLTRI